MIVLLTACGRVTEDRFFAEIISANWHEGGLASAERRHFLSYRVTEDGEPARLFGVSMSTVDARGPLFIVDDDTLPGELLTFHSTLWSIPEEALLGWMCRTEDGLDDDPCIDASDVTLVLFGGGPFFLDLEAASDPLQQRLAEESIRAIIAGYRNGHPNTELDEALAQEERFAIPEFR